MKRVPRNVVPAAEDAVFQGDPADVRKLIFLGFLGLMITFGTLGGALYLYNRPTGILTASDDGEGGVPSMRGLLHSAASGGRLDARQFDKAMGNMCQQIGESRGDSMLTERCRKSMRGGLW